MNILSEEQLNSIITEYKKDCERAGFQDDWWTAIPGEWDVNVFEEDGEEHPYRMAVTLYKLIDGDETDYTNFHSKVARFDASEFDDISMLKKKIDREEQEYNEYLNDFKDADPLDIIHELIGLGNRGKMYFYDDFQKVEDLSKLLKNKLIKQNVVG
jgi:hypothetical protein